MSVILLQFPKVEPTPNGRPRHCPYCGSSILQRWGRVTKTVRDTHHTTTEVHRYRCGECYRTFRDYPEGIDRANQTLRIRHLAALAWAMGLSCRDVVVLFRDMGVRLSRMTVWRDGQELVARLNAESPDDFSPAFSLDRSYMSNEIRRIGVTMAIDVGQGKAVILGTLDEHNPRTVISWLDPIIADLELEAVMLGTGGLNLPAQSGNGRLFQHTY